jgi:hypothetical protein
MPAMNQTNLRKKTKKAREFKSPEEMKGELRRAFEKNKNDIFRGKLVSHSKTRCGSKFYFLQDGEIVRILKKTGNNNHAFHLALQ